jgi:hypothetical protein
MLWKRKKDIFPQERRQVHAVIVNGNSVLALERQMAGPMVKLEAVREWFKTANALAIEGQVQVTLKQQAVIHPLHFQLVIHRLGDPDHLVMRIDVQFAHIHATGQTDRAGLQMTKVNEQRHRTPG